MNDDKHELRPKRKETQEEYLSRAMDDDDMKKRYPDESRRRSYAMSWWKLGPGDRA